VEKLRERVEKYLEKAFIPAAKAASSDENSD